MWSTLLAFAHLAERRSDAQEHEPDPVEEVQRQAEQILGEQAAGYQKTVQDSSQAVPREGEITFIPFVEGIEFNPYWEEPFPAAPEKNLPPEALTRLHFQRLSLAVTAPPGHSPIASSVSYPPPVSISDEPFSYPSGDRQDSPTGSLSEESPSTPSQYERAGPIDTSHQMPPRYPPPTPVGAGAVGSAVPPSFPPTVGVDASDPQSYATPPRGQPSDPRGEEARMPASEDASRRRFLSACWLIPVAVLVIVSTASIAILFSSQSTRMAQPNNTVGSPPISSIPPIDSHSEL